LTQHPHRDGYDVLRIPKPHHGIVKIANEPVWGTRGAQTRPFRPRKPLTLEALDSVSGPIDVEHQSPQLSG
jgi:hypothetical protein